MSRDRMDSVSGFWGEKTKIKNIHGDKIMLCPLYKTAGWELEKCIQCDYFTFWPTIPYPPVQMP